VRVIDENGDQLGIMEQIDAKNLADERGLNLVEMSAVSIPPTCKIMDYGKWKYTENKRKHGQKSSVTRRKEIKLRPKCEEHDFMVKVNHARRFLEKKHKVLVTMMFRGREAMHLDLGRVLLKRFAETLTDLAKVEKEPTKEGRNKMEMILTNR